MHRKARNVETLGSIALRALDARHAGVPTDSVTQLPRPSDILARLAFLPLRNHLAHRRGDCLSLLEQKIAPHGSLSFSFLTPRPHAVYAQEHEQTLPSRVFRRRCSLVTPSRRRETRPDVARRLFRFETFPNKNSRRRATVLFSPFSKRKPHYLYVHTTCAFLYPRHVISTRFRTFQSFFSLASFSCVEFSNL